MARVRAKPKEAGLMRDKPTGMIVPVPKADKEPERMTLLSVSVVVDISS